MTKYIIKNCPSFYDINDVGYCTSRCVNELQCQYCTDCLLKRIVKLCKEVIKYNVIDLGMSVMASDVLRLLEIEELPNEQL